MKCICTSPGGTVLAMQGSDSCPLTIYRVARRRLIWRMTRLWRCYNPIQIRGAKIKQIVQRHSEPCLMASTSRLASATRSWTVVGRIVDAVVSSPATVSDAERAAPHA